MSKNSRNIEVFKHHLALAETGELQNAARSFLGFKFNPYYTANNHVVRAVASYAFPILPNLLHAQESQQRIYDVSDIYQQYPSLNTHDHRYYGGFALQLATGAGLVVHDKVTGYHLTEEGIKRQPYSVSNPNNRQPGCLVPVAAGILFGRALGAPFGGEAPLTAEVLHFGLGAFTALGVLERVKEIRDARAAYKDSLEYPDPVET